MRLTLLICLLCSINSFGQDTIVFKDGHVELVKILSVENGLIQYKKRKDTLETKEFLEFSNDGVWYHLDKSTATLTSSTKPKNAIHLGFFRAPSIHNSGRFWISTNLAAPFFHNERINTEPHGHYDNVNAHYLFNMNRTFSLEPEFLINPFFSLKTPLIIGLAHFKPGTLYNKNTPTGFDNPYDVIGFFDYNKKTTLNSSSEVEVNPEWGEYHNVRGHTKDLYFQLGVTPKIYPFGQNKNAFFIAQNFAIGLIDFYTVEYYATFDTTSGPNEWGYGNYRKWSLTEEYAVQKSSPFLYFRYEMSVGFNLNWGKIIGFSIEAGASSQTRKNREEDKVYTRINNDPYELVNTHYYNYKSTLYPFGRVHLVFKIPPKKL